jgi:UDP-N-acetylmuramoylalanine--D-glutamate ligase
MAQAIDGRQKVVQFSLEQEVEVGTFLRGDTVNLRLDSRTQEICHVGELRLLGRHNLANVLAACALAGTAGASPEALRLGATTFSGVEHRLELVREWNGVRWYNDSIATAPERTVAALRAFSGDPVVLLAGGRDKHLPWEEMADLTWKQARHVILFGEAAGLIQRAMDNSPFLGQGSCQIHRAGTLERAVEVATQVVQPGDVVLLSPGGTSFDAYRDFAARGEHFRELVSAMGES